MIAVLTPSRGRPERLTGMVDSIRVTSEREVAVYVGLDDDDVLYPEIPGVRMSRRPRKRLASWTNVLAEQALQDGHTILAFLGDDHRPRTHGWDTRIIEAMAALGDGLVYADDGLQGERLPTAPFWSAKIIRALGFYYPPVLDHLFADDYFLRLAHDLGRCIYLPDVLIEHMHPSIGKAPDDESYRESAACWDRDERALQAFLRDEHPAARARVLEAL
jgi:hypothetical protein